MDLITLKGKEIPYTISFKRNKNTYFYFKTEGYIQVNASTYQTKKQIINHMIKNADLFIHKYEKAQSKKQETDPNSYYLWGTKYHIEFIDNLKEIYFNDESVFLPLNQVDQEKILKSFDKTTILKELNILYTKYLHNKYVDISNITIKTRYTKTRFGSCNAVKRNINFNTNLIHYDKVYLEYVFLHEICHLVYQDHSVNFYRLLEKLCPNYKQVRKELRNIYRK